jgi:hypothetical protein
MRAAVRWLVFQRMLPLLRATVTGSLRLALHYIYVIHVSPTSTRPGGMSEDPENTKPEGNMDVKFNA